MEKNYICERCGAEVKCEVDDNNKVIRGNYICIVDRSVMHVCEKCNTEARELLKEYAEKLQAWWDKGSK